jgi:general secretion pathway protein E
VSASHAIPYEFARAQQVALVRDEGAYAELAITRDTAVEAIAEVRRLVGKPVRTQRMEPEAFAHALANAYDTAQVPTAQNGPANVPTAQLETADDLLATRTDDGPAAQWVNQLFVCALNGGASDIHLEPFERSASARIRVDGELRDAPLDTQDLAALYPALVARLKVLARLDLAERRLPQDGRLTVQLAGRAIDVRMSTLPCAFGERVVLRLLDKSAARLDLHALGFSEGTLVQFRRMLAMPHGIVLVTGPTGSGKTTTLYAALLEIAKRTRNVMTVEDPIEYSLPGIAQTAVNPLIGLTFARALRSILRQDPDVILVGEIRDAETAQIAVQASLTGHLVLATLHTNDAASAVTRLMDMGIEPYLLASSLRGVVAQRLVRKLCTHCRAKVSPSIEAQRQLRAMGASLEALYEPRGCERCNATGYAGRTGVYEALTVDTTLRDHIHSAVDHGTIRDTAISQGMVSLGRDGARWLAPGVTSLDEVLRIQTDFA